MFVEICVDSIQSAINAEKGGADRIELCSNLAVGGTSPSAGLIKQCKQLLTIPINVLIRPRGGDFTYNKEELNQILDDIVFCKKIGVNGIVVGNLHENGDIDFEFLHKIMAIKGNLELTYHRAFDVCRKPVESLLKLEKIGVDRVLTSGQAATAWEGIDSLTSLNKLLKGDLKLLAGSGVRSHNVKQIISRTGITEVHATAFGQYKENASYMHQVQMGHSNDSNSCKETDIEIVKELCSLVGDME